MERNETTYNTIETLRRTMFKIQFNMNEADSNAIMNAIKVLGKNQFNEELGEVRLATTEERGEEFRRMVEVTDTQRESITAYYQWLSYDNNRTGVSTKDSQHSVTNEEVDALGELSQRMYKVSQTKQ